MSIPWFEQLDLQFRLTNSAIACISGRPLVVLVVCDLCRPDGSHVWMGWTTFVTWLSPGTKLYYVLAHVQYAPQRHQLLGGNLVLFLLNVCKTDAIWGQGYMLWAVQSWPICR